MNNANYIKPLQIFFSKILTGFYPFSKQCIMSINYKIYTNIPFQNSYLIFYPFRPMRNYKKSFIIS